MPPTFPTSVVKAIYCHHSPSQLLHVKTQPLFSRAIYKPQLIIPKLHTCSNNSKISGAKTHKSLPVSTWRRLAFVEGDRIPKNNDDEENKSNFLTLPTVLTLGRVGAVPLLVSTFYMHGSWAATATTSIFVAASITDWLDGYIARKMQLGSTFGAFLDPVADKLMVAATLVLLCTRQLEIALFEAVPWILAVPSIVIVGREVTMSAVREWAASQDSKVLEVVAVNNLGKWKTATQMTALTLLLAARDPSLTGHEGLVISGVGLLYVSAALATWSLVVYMRNIRKLLFK